MITTTYLDSKKHYIDGYITINNAPCAVLVNCETGEIQATNIKYIKAVPPPEIKIVMADIEKMMGYPPSNQQGDKIMSREKKFTPGPWEWQKTRNSINGHPHTCFEVISPISNDPDYDGIGISVGMLPDEDKTKETIGQAAANAHLIAQSPAMFKVLEDLVDYFSKPFELPEDAEIEKIVEAARDTISAAYGETE
jgi:hypothetical protein